MNRKGTKFTMKRRHKEEKRRREEKPQGKGHTRKRKIIKI
jgi:hypothetical protein